MKNNSIIKQIKNLKERKTLLFQHYRMTNEWLLYDSIYKNLSDEELIERRDEIIKIQFDYLDKWLLHNLNIKIDTDLNIFMRGPVSEIKHTSLEI